MSGMPVKCKMTPCQHSADLAALQTYYAVFTDGVIASIADLPLQYGNQHIGMRFFIFACQHVQIGRKRLDFHGYICKLLLQLINSFFRNLIHALFLT